MAQSDAQLHKVARALVQRIYVNLSVVANCNHTQIRDAIGQIDSGMNATGNQIAALYPTTALKTAMFQRMQTVAPNITGQQAAVALALWALEEAGLLT